MMPAPDRLIRIISALLPLARAGRIPALYVDAGIIRIPWQAGRFRRLTLPQAERLIAGESLHRVLKFRHPPPKPKVKAKPAPAPRPRSRRPPAKVQPWQLRRMSYLAAKARG